jgi:hypothetical protein
MGSPILRVTRKPEGPVRLRRPIPHSIDPALLALMATDAELPAVPRRAFVEPVELVRVLDVEPVEVDRAPAYDWEEPGAAS